jgi:hypothetical protein
MAEDAKSYPMVPARHWFALRERFKKAIPKTITSSYLASALQMEERSASNNIMPGLKATGLVAEDGTPQNLAIKWRDDAHYKETCESIRANVYPQELLDLAPPESATVGEVKTWFAREGGIGDSAAGKLASFYMLLCDGNPQGATAKAENGKTARAPRLEKRIAKKSPNTPEKHKAATKDVALAETHAKPRAPSLSLNLQILISPDATAEQIDKIFESMAKHLKDFG